MIPIPIKFAVVGDYVEFPSGQLRRIVSTYRHGLGFVQKRDGTIGNYRAVALRRYYWRKRSVADGKRKTYYVWNDFAQMGVKWALRR